MIKHSNNMTKNPQITISLIQSIKFNRDLIQIRHHLGHHTTLHLWLFLYPDHWSNPCSQRSVYQHCQCPLCDSYTWSCPPAADHLLLPSWFPVADRADHCLLQPKDQKNNMQMSTGDMNCHRPVLDNLKINKICKLKENIRTGDTQCELDYTG